MKTLYLAIISIGLILGIGITIMFGILMGSRQPNINIAIQGLKDTYEIGERFSFHVKVNGYGSFCGDPAVEIFKTTNRSEIVWTYDRNEFIGICTERDLDDAFGFRNISINQTGSYLVSVNNKIEKEFSVVQSTQELSDNQVFTFHDPYQNIENSTGIVTIRNHVYYSLVLNDNVTSYKAQGTKISFHDVVFTLLPTPPFVGPVGSCGGVGLKAVAKFPDDTYEPVEVSVLGRPCSINYTETDLTVHTNPQAGLSVSDQELRLLVSADNQPLFYPQKEYLSSIPLDFSNASNENPLGIEAKVVNEPDTAIMCPIENCKIPPTPHLVLTSQKGSQFVGYEVCNGLSCKKDRLSDGLYVWLSNIPENYTGANSIMIGHINLGNLPWKKGDIVHIKVIAFPASLLENNVVIRQTDQIMIVDLGKSRIE